MISFDCLIFLHLVISALLLNGGTGSFYLSALSRTKGRTVKVEML